MRTPIQLKNDVVTRITSSGKEWLKALDRVDSRPISVWHYTSLRSFESIIRTKKIRATNISFLNDSQEYHLYKQMVLDTIIEFKVKAKGRIATEIDEFVRLYPQHPSTTFPQHFVACFSEAEESSAQWIAYGGGEGGVAIQFDVARMTAQMHRPGFSFFPVIYSATAQKKVLYPIFEWAIQELSKLELEYNNKLNDSDYGYWFGAFHYALDSLAPYFKDQAFCDEREWRFVCRDQKLSDVEFVARESFFSYYTDIDLSEEVKNSKTDEELKRLAIYNKDKFSAPSEVLPITGVVVGPGRMASETRQAIELFLIKNGYAGVPVTLSRVPYRIAR